MKVLSDAIRANDLAAFKQALADGADPAGTAGDSTPLMLAAHRRQVEMVKILLDRGVAVNARSPHGRTALHDAIWQYEPAVAKLLLDAGADVHAADQDNWTPIWMTSLLEPFDLLLDCGAKVDMRAANGDTLLRRVAEAASHSHQDDGLAILNKLVELGLRVADEPLDHHGHTLLMAIVDRKPNDGHNLIAHWLLEQGMDPKHASPVNVTALHYACQEDDLDMVHALLARGADPNARVTEEWYMFEANWRPIDACKSYASKRKQIAAALLAAGQTVDTPTLSIELEDGDAIRVDSSNLGAALDQMIAISRDLEANVFKHPDYANADKWFGWRFSEHADELAFFSACVDRSKLRPMVARYVQHIIAANAKRGGEPVYVHEELEAGAHAIEALVRTGDDDYLELLLQYIQSIDIDHTVHLHDLMTAVREKFTADQLGEVTATLEDLGFES